MAFRDSRSERFELGDQQLVVAEVVDLEGNVIAGEGVVAPDAEAIAFDDSVAELGASTVQEAIEELKALIDAIEV